jgi:hypothetical protein
MLQRPPKLNIPNGADPVPWLFVFLIVFLSVSCVSGVMSMIDAWRDRSTASPTPRPIIPENVETTEAPLIPETVQRRYAFDATPERPYDYLYTDSSMTR